MRNYMSIIFLERQRSLKVSVTEITNVNKRAQKCAR